MLRELGVSSKICENFADMMVKVNGSNLSLTDAVLCSIARCLLSSVDLLLISNVLDVLGEEEAFRVLEVLKKMVEQRRVGLGQ